MMIYASTGLVRLPVPPCFLSVSLKTIKSKPVKKTWPMRGLHAAALTVTCDGTGGRKGESDEGQGSYRDAKKVRTLILIKNKFIMRVFVFCPFLFSFAQGY